MYFPPITKKVPLCGGFKLLLCLMLFTAGVLEAQQAPNDFARKFNSGVRLYSSSRMAEAAAEFRGAQEIAVNPDDWAHALYWVILSELAIADYGSAIKDMDELARKAPDSYYNKDMAYHRARAYFNQGFFEEALLLFRQYSENVPSQDGQAANRRAAAFFWMGECLYSMGQFEEAEKFYAWVIARYPGSPKIEAASYRIDLIKQKKIETELLALLRWSHEESLRTSEDYQRKLKTYENAINSYQRRIAELTQTPASFVQDSAVTESVRQEPPVSTQIPDYSADEQILAEEISEDFSLIENYPVTVENPVEQIEPENEAPAGNIQNPNDELRRRARQLEDLRRLPGAR
ncbi:MAG: tetratricopeptide repeat protein [Treponema sp.]|jgi:TolA-binding protein|nr:tetratricopeptide repeat protein [Treponema sp.]